MAKVTNAQLAEQVEKLSEQLAALVAANSSSAAVQVPDSGTSPKYQRRGRRGPAKLDKRQSYLNRKIEIADGLAKSKGVHYSIFEMSSGKLFLFSERTEHIEAQKGHKATEKWGPRLYNTLSGITATGTSYIS